jgi:hypothetical protein
MKKIAILLSLVVLFAVSYCGQAMAAEVMTEVNSSVTFEELNQEEVFIKQSRRGTCTLAASAMIMRRAAMLAGNENWVNITESSLGRVAWTSVGITWQFTYEGVTMVHDYVSSVEDLKRLLEEHPEGIVAYDSYKPHAIALTDYDEEEDVFYCSDPSEACASGRVPVSEALISLSNVDVVWYVSSPSNLTIAEEEAEEETTEEIVEIRSYPLVSLEKMDLIAD